MPIDMSKMTIQRLRMHDLKPYEKNVKIHTKRNLETIKNSLKEFGQYKPIVVRKGTNEILCGNGTFQAAQALGWTDIDCNVIDVDDEKAKALVIVDNRSSDLSEYDEKNLLDLLQDMDKGLLDLTGYDDKELDKMLQFHEGELFKDEEKKPKEKEKKKEVAVSADDQVSFTLMGFPFVLSDPDQIKELKDLMDRFTVQNIEVRCETTFEMWNAIRDVLANAVGDAGTPTPFEGESGAEPENFEIETDRG